MMDDPESNDQFLSLLRARRNRRAIILSSLLSVPSSNAGNAHHGKDGAETHSDSYDTGQSNLSTHFLFSTARPQNEIQNPYPYCFEGYPKLQRLTDLKKALVSHRAHPPTSLRIDWKSEDLLSKLTWGIATPIQPSAQGLRFDVIVLSEGGGRDHFSEVTNLASLPIESLAATPSFLFLWLPSSDLLEIGRALLQRWGFRRAEDIVWVKTNHAEIQKWKAGGPMPSRRRRPHDSNDAVFVRTKEHCLMGIRGTVRRSVDSHFIHCNIDTDVIVAEDSAAATKEKPEELFNIVENFCMGRRRLEIFGSDSSLRPGWLTVGDNLSASTYDAKEYLSYFHDGNLIGHHQGIGGLNDLNNEIEIEILRPKSPVSKPAVPGLVSAQNTAGSARI